MNVYQRRYKLTDLKDKPYADYTPEEMVSYCTTAFPGDPIGALNSMRDNLEIGNVLYSHTRTLLEVIQNVKRDKTHKAIS